MSSDFNRHATQKSSLRLAPGIEDDDENLIDVAVVLAALGKHWLILLILSFCGAVAGYVLSYLKPPLYRGETLLTMVSDDQGGGGGLRSIAGQYGALASLVGVNISGSDNSKAATLAMLRSHRFVEQFISDEQLMPELFPKRWDAQTKQWKTDGNKPVPTLQDGADVFLDKALTVVEDRKGGLVTVRIDMGNRAKLAQWTNAFVAKANEVTRDQAIRSATQSIDYLNKELPRADTVELKQSIYSLLESQMNRRMLASTRPDFAFRVIDPAQTPNIKARISPSRVVFALGGLVLALTLGSIVVFILRRNAAQ